MCKMLKFRRDKGLGFNAAFVEIIGSKQSSMITAAGSNKHNFVRFLDKRDKFFKMLFLVGFKRSEHALNNNWLFHNFFEHEMVIVILASVLFFPDEGFNLFFNRTS